MKRIHLFLAYFLISFANLTTSSLYASTTGTTDGKSQIKGHVVDADTKEELIGATVMIHGTSIGAATDIDGNFQLQVARSGKMTIVIRMIGFDEVRKDVNVNGNINVGTIALKPNSIGLDEVSVIASIVKTDRLTPVPISNIKIDVLEEKLGNQEFPEILKSTPSVYATKSGGGYGDSRINMRGFDSNNIGVLVNGVPVNDMENGRVYWSNWAGLSDVTQFMQVQRGLGASKLAISSAGGTINILTKSTEAKRGGTAFYGVGNDGLQKQGLTMSTGLMDNGWAVTFSGARNVADGYIPGTDYEGWSYFVNVAKMLNDNHRLSFTAFGAPQWHNQRGQMHTIEQYQNSPQGIKWNSGYGYMNNKLVGGPYAYNEYHKPQMSLNHFWNIDDKSNLSTAVYASLSSGGSRRVRGNGKNWLTWDNKTGLPYEDTKLTPDGFLDYDYAIAQNAASANGESQVAFTQATNSHDWYGVLSSYNNQLTDKISITGGFDGRYYKGYHFEEITDLLGGQYLLDNAFQTRDPKTPLKVGDKLGFYSIGEVLWSGLFAQGEYDCDLFSSFISGSVTYESYRNEAKDKLVGNGGGLSDWQNFLPFSVKAGFNYKFTDNMNAFFNAGYFTRAPYFNNVFKNYTVNTYDKIPYEKIRTLEGGWSYSIKNFNVTANAYYTEWLDKGSRVSLGQESAILRGMNARHAGVELESTYRPIKGMEVKGMFSWGDWIWKDDVNFSLYDDSNNLLGTYNAYVKGVHVGNSAQMTAALSLSYECFNGFKIGADWNYFGKNYADFDPSNRTSAEDAVDSWKMPDYTTVDLQLSYRLKLHNGINVSFFSGVNNLFNTEYIADARDGVNHDYKTAMVYYGFGTTWNAGLKVNF